MTIKLPDIPTPKDFASHAQYDLALATWLKACKLVVAGNVAVVGVHDDVKSADWISELAEIIHDNYPAILRTTSLSVADRLKWLRDAIHATANGWP